MSQMLLHTSQIKIINLNLLDFKLACLEKVYGFWVVHLMFSDFNLDFFLGPARFSIFRFQLQFSSNPYFSPYTHISHPSLSERVTILDFKSIPVLLILFHAIPERRVSYFVLILLPPQESFFLFIFSYIQKGLLFKCHPISYFVTQFFTQPSFKSPIYAITSLERYLW